MKLIDEKKFLEEIKQYEIITFPAKSMVMGGTSLQKGMRKNIKSILPKHLKDLPKKAEHPKGSDGFTYPSEYVFGYNQCLSDCEKT